MLHQCCIDDGALAGDGRLLAGRAVVSGARPRAFGRRPRLGRFDLGQAWPDPARGSACARRFVPLPASAGSIALRSAEAASELPPRAPGASWFHRAMDAMVSA
jgi:hypothetical protein